MISLELAASPYTRSFHPNLKFLQRGDTYDTSIESSAGKAKSWLQGRVTDVVIQYYVIVPVC